MKRSLGGFRSALLLIWDGLAAHRSAQVHAFLDSTQGVVVERLPAYAPELNPVEYLWGHLKNHQLSHFAPETLAPLAAFGRRALRRIQKRPSIIAAFWVQAELPCT
ncbi:MAG: transposase [Candidatus Methylacidiphilaceae bacterium]